MTLPKNCQARQHSDQMYCGSCGLQWDVNDPDPPECRRDHKPVTPVLNSTGSGKVESKGRVSK